MIRNSVHGGSLILALVSASSGQVAKGDDPFGRPDDGQVPISSWSLSLI